MSVRESLITDKVLSGYYNRCIGWTLILVDQAA